MSTKQTTPPGHVEALHADVSVSGCCINCEAVTHSSSRPLRQKIHCHECGAEIRAIGIQVSFTSELTRDDIAEAISWMIANHWKLMADDSGTTLLISG